MSSAFHFSETSAFAPVPLDIYDYMGPPQPASTSLDLFAPLCEYDSRHIQQTLIEQWIANLHQPSYESTIPLNALSYPYLHEYLGEPGFIRKRNERERMRVRSVNEGYARLRDHLPLEPTEKRLSKVETLRGAIKYIRLLETILKETESLRSITAELNLDENENFMMNNKENEEHEEDETEFINSPTFGEDQIVKRKRIRNEMESPSIIDVENT